MSFIPDATQAAIDRKNPKSDDTQTIAKPITQSEDFCAELVNGTMDFSHIIDKQFIVAVNTGPRNKPAILASTMRGPFEFYEMVEVVGCMWEREQHHAKVYVLTKDFNKSSSFLDEGTIDYIESRWEDIVATGILEAALMDDGPTIPAGLISASQEDE
jgi:hypothetical protein